ncbi:hypothetical protein E3E14_21355 [Streptomyces sp. ICN441]|uniref:SapC family protein n=1 Tax=Streptomyces sp. ICN441 TaxID=2558286 RepID=UPI00106B7E95|nr:SapC family protein [Streptomyces sp. ICN441]TFE47351.1 hypothetical protein E3E14_21355 [Streptomyces sp. ICN441]
MGLVPLNRADHASLRLVGRETMEFTETAHIATLATAEFADAAPTYPIVFADNNGRPGPCALLGLDQGRNQYLMPNGHWLLALFTTFDSGCTRLRAARRRGGVRCS